MKRFVSVLLIMASTTTLVLAGGAKDESSSSGAAPAAMAQQSAAVVEGKLTVAAAANLSALAETLKAAFIAEYPAVSLDFVFGSSGSLTTQIKNGAPFQVFMSADVSFPSRLNAEGFAAGPEKVYATGTLVLLSPTARDFSEGLALLKDPSVEHFAIANPETAPYGKASVEAMVFAGLWDDVKSKVVTAQSITQSVQYTLTATGLGFVNKSALYTKDLAPYTDKEGVNWIPVDPSTHDPIAQAFIVLKSAENDPVAKAFADFLSTESAKDVFRSFGYAVP